MGFSRKGGNRPAHIRDLDYNVGLHNSQVWVLADWMGCKYLVVKEKSEAERRARLKECCERDLDRAQQGYEVIVLCKTTAKVAEKSETDKQLYSVLVDILNANREEMAKLTSEGVDTLVAAVKKQIAGEAKKALAEASENFRPLAIVGQGKPRKVKGILPAEFERMVKLASQRIPIMLVGPAGCGKTYLADRLAQALGMEYSDQSCSEGMSESVFNGLLLPIGKGGEFKHVSSPFMERYETGGVMLLDEIDAGDPNLFTYINKAIANTSYTVAQRWTKSTVQKHSDFVLVAAANTYGHGADSMYVGRNQLDAATLDRFKVGLITMDYSREVEKSLAPDELCEWAWKIRDAIRSHKLRRVMSTRTIKDLATMTEAYKWSKKDWEDTYFASWPQDEKSQVIRSIV